MWILGKNSSKCTRLGSTYTISIICLSYSSTNYYKNYAFYLTYEHEAKLSIHFQETSEKDFTILDRIVKLIDNLPFICEQTRKQIQKVQQKQKEYHDQ